VSIHQKRLRSGKPSYEVKLRSPNGRQYSRTFRTRREAEDFVARERAALLQGTWLDPNAGKEIFGTYAARWLKMRGDIRPRTLELYDYLLRHHLVPEFGETPLKRISPAQVRAWNSNLLARSGVGPSTVAKAYRLLGTIMATAVADELIVRTPCILKGASVERPAERPVITLAEVAVLADGVEPRFRCMVLLATWAGMRFGELAGLTRSDIDLDARTVCVSKQLQELRGGVLVVGPPKTDAGNRTISLPPHVVPEIESHIHNWVGVGADALMFSGPEGGPLRRSNFNRRVWHPACATSGLQGFRFHDLRHTGNTLAAATGASTKELMARMGHSSSRAALIYQHATLERDRALADALSKLAESMGEAPARLQIVGDSETECSIDVRSPEKSKPSSGPTGSIRPDQTRWRRWDSNPRPPACKFDRGVRGRTTWRVWPNQWRSGRSLNSHERRRMFPKCSHGRIRPEVPICPAATHTFPPGNNPTLLSMTCGDSSRANTTAHRRRERGTGARAFGPR
jgi:integrase